MTSTTTDELRAAITALEGQRAALGDAVVELATAPLRARLAALQGPAGLQHRQMTVLFADVVGSTAMAHAVDAEDAMSILNGAMERMAAIVLAHRGRVLKFTGDGVKAAFGMDEVREDDAERAVRAGLDIVLAGQELAAQARQWQGVADFAVRVGVHTGDVARGAGVEADNTAIGAAVHIAARMEQTAAPGSLRISHDAWSQVRGLFEVEPQAPLQVKGVDAPMQTYLVRAALDRHRASVERGLQGLATPLVGREAERQRVQDVVARAAATRQMHSLTLLGEAGLGKSRLLREALAGLPGCRLLTLRAQPDGLLQPWGLLRSLLGTQCGVADTDSAQTARHKVVEGLSPWFAERGDTQARLIGQLSGLDFADSPQVKGLDPRSLRDQALAAVRAYLHGLAVKGDALPVLVVEDLHWADDSSLDLLQHLLDHAAELPLALLMSARPPLLARRPDWGPPEARLTLHPLTAAHSHTLASALLQRLPELPLRLCERIVGQAEGNPYYMEELVRRLIDDGVIAVDGPHWTVKDEQLAQLRLPTTLVGLLQARLDALPPGERQAARLASVIGHVFWDEALQALDAQAPQALPALQRAAFVKAHLASHFDGTAERQFDHHLLHQVTYDTLLKSERRQGHGAAARWLAQRTRGRGAEFLALTGEHAERAGDSTLAINCFEQAGREAQSRYANTAAMAWLRRALDLLGSTEPARRLDLLARLEEIADTLGDRSGQEALHDEAAALLVQHPNDQGQAMLAWFKALLADRRSDTATAQQHCQQACRLAESSGAAHTAARANGLMAWLRLSQHDTAGAQTHLQTGLHWAGQIADPALREVSEAQLLAISAMVLKELCQFEPARTALLAVLSRGESLPSIRLQGAAMDNLADIATRLGQWEQVRAWTERQRALSLSCGALRDVARAQSRLAKATWALGETVQSQQLCELNLDSYRRIGDDYMASETLRSLAELRLLRGDLPAALDFATQAQAMYATPTETLQACEATALRALCQVRLGQPEAARTAIDEVLVHLQGTLAGTPAHDSIELRWTCHELLQTLGDERAAALLDALHHDVQARVSALTEAADRERLVQAQPVFRAVVAAHRGRATLG